jgi:hypothetical protein
MSEKKLLIEKEPGSTLFRIRWEGGGQVPALLAGGFTSVKFAEEQIALWKEQTQRTTEVAHSDKNRK